MAWTERYVRDDASGTGDGTNNTTNPTTGAFTFAQMVADTAATSTRYWVREGSYSSGAATIGTGGATGTGNMIVGFKIADGPGTLPTLRDDPAAARIDVSNWPVITMTGTLTLGAYAMLMGVSIISAQNSSVLAGGTETRMIHCRVESTHASGTGGGISGGTTYSAIDDCDVLVSSSNASTANMGLNPHRGTASGCRVEMLNNGGVCYGSGLSTSITRCVGIGGINSCYLAGGNNTAIEECSFFGWTTGAAIFLAGGQIRVKNCVGYSAETGSQWYTGGGTIRGHLQINNAVSAVDADTDLGDYPVFGEVTLTVDPFTNSGTGDLTLNNTAGGGAVCRDAALGPNLDVGAAQSATSIPIVKFLTVSAG